MWERCCACGRTALLLGHNRGFSIRSRFGSEKEQKRSRGRLSTHDRLGTSEAKASFTLGDSYRSAGSAAPPKSQQQIPRQRTARNDNKD